MQKAHTNFAQRYTKSGLACALPFHLWEAETSLRYKTPKEFSVQDPTPNAMPLLYRALESKPLAYREALDLVPARLGLEAIKETWQRAGLHRERQIRIAYHQGRPVAASILESTDVGVNLFHILEGVRLFPLVPNPPSRAYQALLDDAARWYQERGRHAFVYYQEEAAPPTQMTDLGAGLLWLLSAELLPEWLEHIFRLTE